MTRLSLALRGSTERSCSRRGALTWLLELLQHNDEAVLGLEGIHREEPQPHGGGRGVLTWELELLQRNDEAVLGLEEIHREEPQPYGGRGGYW
jgi:hypothetical protein